MFFYVDERFCRRIVLVMKPPRALRDRVLRLHAAPEWGPDRIKIEISTPSLDATGASWQILRIDDLNDIEMIRLLPPEERNRVFWDLERLS
jgi:hypothetical protein